MSNAKRPACNVLQKPPTTEQFTAYQKAWDYFNEKLFDGELRPCLLNFSRKHRARGFFWANRWTKEGATCHEISLNPDVLARPVEESMGTLVHEMAHQWQQDNGHPSRTGYHNKEWADKMEQIGLIPSQTGEPGGKKTGQREWSIQAGVRPDARGVPDSLEKWRRRATAEKVPKPGQDGIPVQLRQYDLGQSGPPREMQAVWENVPPIGVTLAGQNNFVTGKPG